jgi:plastocyanin
MTQRNPALMLAIALSLLPQSVAAGVIRGLIRMPSTSSAPVFSSNPYPGRISALPGRRYPAHGLVTDAVAYVTDLAPGANAKLKAPSSSVLAQKNQAFSARVLPCVVGTTVDFPNQDPIYHNVFSVSPVKRFDLGKYRKGGSRQVTFQKPGLVPVFCDIHANMASFIIVLPNRAFVQPDADGVFALPDLPAGTYVLKFWHPDHHEMSRTVRVPASGDVHVDVSF